MLKFAYQFTIIGIIILLHFYFYSSQHIENSDQKFYDLTTRLINTAQASQSNTYTVIVDIDEKSLQQLGQWPWPRVLDAELINTLQLKNPSAIGVNILFSESDRLSPLSIQHFYKQFFNLSINLEQIPMELKDNDALLSQSLQKANATLSIYLNNSSLTKSHCDQLLYKKYNFNQLHPNFHAKSVLCNEKKIQTNIENFGFINVDKDSDGVLRRMPMVMRYKDKTFLSFALATLLSFDKNFKINTDESTILINFWKKKPKVFSAIDILRGKIPSSELQGKIIIIGSSVIGFNPVHTTATNQKISNSMVHALAIENLLDNNYIIQPEYYQKLNLLFSIVISLITFFLFKRKLYLMVSLFIISLLFISFVWLAHAYTQGVYISIGYLWLPIFYTLVFIVIVHLRTLDQERQAQEKFLIKQSKLASMGEMISLIAHQWRQPLSAINGTVLNIDMDYRKNPLDNDALNTHLNTIEETTAYLSKTISDFSDFFSNDKIQETFFISDVMIQARSLTHLKSDDNITIVYRQKENIEITGYKSELLQSILILLNNAIYECQRNLLNTHQGQITIETNETQNGVSISIEDNGGGINKKYLHKIFNPYFTTKAKPHGTGLGLYILKLIVEDSMNGKVSVANNAEGATFTIEVPKNLTQESKITKKFTPTISLS